MAEWPLDRSLWPDLGFDKLTPAEQREYFRECIVRDVSTLPEGYLDKIRADFLAEMHLDANGDPLPTSEEESGYAER